MSVTDNYVCLQIKSFQDYVQLYLKVKQDDEDELMGPRKVLYEEVNARWEVCVTLSSVGFQQASFVNSIATTKVCVLPQLHAKVKQGL